MVRSTRYLYGDCDMLLSAGVMSVWMGEASLSERWTTVRSSRGSEVINCGLRSS